MEEVLLCAVQRNMKPYISTIHPLMVSCQWFRGGKGREDVQIPPMQKGMQNHVRVMKRRYMCRIVAMLRKIIAGGREGT